MLRMRQINTTATDLLRGKHETGASLSHNRVKRGLVCVFHSFLDKRGGRLKVSDDD